MNKSLLKFLTVFVPLVIFFYYYYDCGKNLKIAIPPFIIATIIALSIMWFLEKKIPKLPLLSGVLITFFGGLTPGNHIVDILDINGCTTNIGVSILAGNLVTANFSVSSTNSCQNNFDFNSF